MKYEVIIPAAGQGKRMKADRNKLWIELEGEPIISHTLRQFGADENCKRILLVVNPSEEPDFQVLSENWQLPVPIELIHGGSERQYSVKNAVDSLTDETEIALVHDGARPFITRPLIEKLIKDAAEHGASVLAVPVKDTIKQAEDSFITKTIERSSLWAIQTPQAFRVSILKRAHSKAQEDGFLGTDDASLVERLCMPVAITEGNYDNIKITTPEDLYFAKAILEKNKGVQHD
ncbi:2-C-methyl-D-erythritol 4-phosphate cytidylyltransferase [Pradoshia sp.]|uniref:2-C-methyl-D-erythritol 4-phosphate cytidylyltransferase n=1 Tax=Pradoshia sp. TaxID=2651281 RepID=UPI003EFE8182